MPIRVNLPAGRQVSYKSVSTPIFIGAGATDDDTCPHRIVGSSNTAGSIKIIMKRTCFFIFTVFFIGYTQAQQNIDSLKKVVAAEHNQSKKIDGLIQLAAAYTH